MPHIPFCHPISLSLFMAKFLPRLVYIHFSFPPPIFLKSVPFKFLLPPLRDTSFAMVTNNTMLLNPIIHSQLFNWATASDTVYPAFLHETHNLAFKKSHFLGFHLSSLASACCLFDISLSFLSIFGDYFSSLSIYYFFGNSSCLMALYIDNFQIYESNPDQYPKLQTRISNCLFDIPVWLSNSPLRLMFKTEL